MPDSPRKRMHKRTHSDEYITGLLGSDPKRNRNVEWLNTPYLLPAYMFFIALFYGVVRGTELVDAGGAWAFTNVVHGSLTFVVLHWWKVRGVSRAKGAMNAGLNQACAGGVRRQSARDPLTISSQGDGARARSAYDSGARAPYRAPRTNSRRASSTGRRCGSRLTALYPRRRPSARAPLRREGGSGEGVMKGFAATERLDLTRARVSLAHARNLLLLVPTVLVLIASIATNYAVAFLPLNLMAWAVLCLFPKLPMMHGVRMFGINSTPGIDR